MRLNALTAVKQSGDTSVEQEVEETELLLRRWYLPQAGVFSEWLKNHQQKDEPSTVKPTRGRT